MKRERNPTPAHELRANDRVKVREVQGVFRVKYANAHYVTTYGGVPGHEKFRSFAVNKLFYRVTQEDA